MKRDWGLIRDLLEHLESLGFGQHWEARELPGHCREAVAYHLQLLNQAQLLCGSVQHSWTGQEQWVVHHLTLAGHDLLDRRAGTQERLRKPRKHRPAAAGRKEARRCPTAKTRPQVRSRP
ncbi:DUF2513 domain-containing protein [Pseudomonas aeruginosa]|uniref:DUF2513 domain-containing protein n=1 Tax=Pseudomonas aeruginosa TaxID=287 RepID=UPI000A8AF88E|nr:DUF2513 domain-containing protein [Pseudomonas aeruginosa]